MGLQSELQADWVEARFQEELVKQVKEADTELGDALVKRTALDSEVKWLDSLKRYLTLGLGAGLSTACLIVGLMLVGNEYEDLELWYPKLRIEEAGGHVTVAGATLRVAHPQALPAGPIVLGGYAAKQCPVRTHNNYAPTVPDPEWVVPAELQELFDAGRQFEAEVQPVDAHGIEFHHSSVLLNTGSTSKMTPRNEKSRWRTTWPIVNLASRVFMIALLHSSSDWKVNVMSQAFHTSVVFRMCHGLATVAMK
jgi:hypothetical protein